MLFILGWFIYIINTPKVYSVKSLIQIEQASSNMSSYEDLLIGGGQTIYLDEQIELYLSRSNLRKLISNLGLNAFVENESNLAEKGKTITLINGLGIQNGKEVKELLKKMKVYCGTGGTLIGEDIQLQGDMVNKSIDFLRNEGFRNL